MSQCSCGSAGTHSFSSISRKFCDNCFVKRFEQSFLKRIPKIARGSSIAVALSGGKDSIVVLHLLNKHRKKLRLKNLSSITLRQEIPKLQQEQDVILSKAKKDYPEVEFVQKSYRELFNNDLSTLVKISDEKKLDFTPCAICGILKRNGILRIALELNVDYLAFGNTLEDEVETIFLNLLRNQPQRNFRDLIIYKTTDGISLPKRLKPLATISESSIKTYTEIMGLKVSKTPCPYKNRSLRSEINPFVRHLQEINPHVLHNTIASIRQQKTLVDYNKEVIVQKCSNCGFYSTSSLCPACSTILRITG